MPTARGWMTAGIGILLTGIGLALGAPDLERLGAALAVIVVSAVIVVRSGRQQLAVTRQLTPAHVSMGAVTQVTVTITNGGRRTLPLLLVADRVAGATTQSSRFTMHGVEAGGTRTLEYELTPPRRGRLEVGPLQVVRLDPFGLARLRLDAGTSDAVLVRPRVERIGSTRRDPQRVGANPASARRPLGGGDQDFYTLREYVEGDDLRKIHWASTAKRGHYTIRQEESRWQGRAAVVLDDRRSVHDPAGFERAVEAAASLADLYATRGFAFALTTASGAGLTFARGALHLGRCLDFLAEVAPGSPPPGTLGRRLGGQTASASDLVLVTGTLDDEAAAAVSRLAASAIQVVALSFPQHRFGGLGTKARWAGEQQSVEHAAVVVRSGARCVTLGPGDRLSVAWAAGTTRRGGGDGAWQTKPALV